MRVIGTIGSTATERVIIEADSYEQARDQLHGQVPEGHEPISIRVYRDGEGK